MTFGISNVENEKLEKIIFLKHCELKLHNVDNFTHFFYISLEARN